jgi:hypothetical protein
MGQLATARIDDLLVEGHQVLQRAAAAGDDDHVGPRDAPAGGRAEKPAMAAAIFSAAPSPCTGTGQRISGGEAPGQGGADVLDDGARSLLTTPMTRGSRGRGFLRARRRTGPSASPAAAVDAGQQGALAGIFQLLDDELVLGAFAIGGDPAGGDHLQPVLRLQPESGDTALFQMTLSILAFSSFSDR